MFTPANEPPPPTALPAEDDPELDMDAVRTVTHWEANSDIHRPELDELDRLILERHGEIAGIDRLAALRHAFRVDSNTQRNNTSTDASPDADQPTRQRPLTDAPQERVA